jgi:hypothetical protein
LHAHCAKPRACLISSLGMRLSSIEAPIYVDRSDGSDVDAYEADHHAPAARFGETLGIDAPFASADPLHDDFEAGTSSSASRPMLVAAAARWRGWCPTGVPCCVPRVLRATSLKTYQ